MPMHPLDARRLAQQPKVREFHLTCDERELALLVLSREADLMLSVGNIEQGETLRCLAALFQRNSDDDPVVAVHMPQ